MTRDARGRVTSLLAGFSYFFALFCLFVTLTYKSNRNGEANDVFHRDK